LTDETLTKRQTVGIDAELPGDGKDVAPLAKVESDAAPVDTSGGGLRLQQVVKRYGDTTVLHGLDLDVHEGEFMTILGPSGSGKSTLLNLIGGFTSLTSGQILLGGRDVSTMSPAERGIGMVFQNYALFPHMTARANVEYGLKMRRWSRAARKARAEEMLAMVGLGDRAGHYPRQLSGGQQQRVALARALAFDPQLLLMDEPLGALDRELRIRMAGELRRIHSDVGTTVVYVTHDREEALTLSDRIAILRDGRLDSLDTPPALFSTPPSSFAASFFGGHNLLSTQVIDVQRSGYSSATVACLGSKLTMRCGDDIAVGQSAAIVLPSLSFSLIDEAGQATASVLLAIDDVLYMGEFTQVRGTIVDDTTNGEQLVVQLSGHHVDGLKSGKVRRFAFDLARCSVVRWSGTPDDTGTFG
jgi:putative spermidine/putrescine transport system ATP-binding protein